MHELTSRQHVERFLGQKGNLEILEDNLASFGREYQLIRSLQGFNPGKRLSYASLWEVLPEVRKEVLFFLGVPEIGSVHFMVFDRQDILRKAFFAGLLVAGMVYSRNPDNSPESLLSSVATGLAGAASLICYGYKECVQSSFSGDGTITLSERNIVPATPSLAHELTHQVCMERGLLKERKNPIAEGFARGVEREIARAFAERYGNPLYMNEPVKQTVMELKDAYLLVCEMQGLKPRESLVGIDAPMRREGILRNKFLYGFFARHYSTGVAAVCIGESKRGREVYREIVKGDFSFLST